MRVLLMGLAFNLGAGLIFIAVLAMLLMVSAMGPLMAQGRHPQETGVEWINRAIHEGNWHGTGERWGRAAVIGLGITLLHQPPP